MENLLQKPLLWLRFRHQIHGIILSSVFEVKINKNDSPTASRNIEKAWPKLNLKKIRFGIDDERTKYHISD